jgi:formylmethanofuran dehydrogenase subunit E
VKEQRTRNHLNSQLIPVLKKAEDFHGHLGPFLVIGVRAGLIGLERLKAKKGDPSLSAVVMLKHSVPFSCVLDGVQITTGCTIGNKRLTLEDSSGIAVRLEKNYGNVEIAINLVAFDKLKKHLLVQNMEADEVRKLAYTVASIEESELFIVKLTGLQAD